MIKNVPIFLIVDTEKPPDSVLRIPNSAMVHTAADCLNTVMKKNIGVVVIDENLPDLPGLKLVCLLKRMKPEIEIIFTTSCHDPQKEIDARLAGILYYGVKPVDWTLLEQIIERALSKQSKNIAVSYHS